ncbi:MAG TPA: hypothetical protein VH916_02155 [Dehalococcoidia bacterium]|jgi:hypothetical protein
MTADKDGLLQQYREMREDLLAAIAGLGDGLLCEQSVDGWSLKGHLAHLLRETCTPPRWCASPPATLSPGA